MPFNFPHMPGEWLKVYIKSLELYLEPIKLLKNELVYLHGPLGALLLVLEDFTNDGKHLPINSQGVQIFIQYPIDVAQVWYPGNPILGHILISHLRKLPRGVMKDLRYVLMGGGRSGREIRIVCFDHSLMQGQLMLLG